MWFNCLIIFFSIGFSIGSYFILEWNIADCDSLRFVLYSVITLHMSNMTFAMINLAGFETKCCNINMIGIFFIYEISILMWMQFSYFDSQKRDCMNSAPDLYFWIFLQILAIYVAVTVVVCHFFRKNCTDDAVKPAAAEGEEPAANDKHEGATAEEVKV